MRHIELNNMLMKRDESGFFQLDKDLEAVAEFMRDVERRSLVFANTKAKVDYMIEQDFYENFYEQYSVAEIEEVYQITHAYNFSFPSYMAASKFYTDYAVKAMTASNIWSIIRTVWRQLPFT